MAESNEVSIDWRDLSKPVKGLKQGSPNKVVIKREVIPIIFVPGIMGSRLRQGNEKVWDPDARPFMFRKYGLASVDAADKKAALIGTHFDENFLDVYLDDTKHNQEKFEEVYPGATARGWGGVSWGSYGSILTTLQNHAWRPLLRTCFHLPVYAFGYNWTASNSLAGKRLKQFIDQTLQQNQDVPKHLPATKVILVTHSMGGLVARSALNEHGASAKVLGVVHGVQPVTGAAAAYWRMKAGVERTGGKLTAWVLGTNGEEVSAVLGNMPGGLELLPSQHYTTNDGSKRWLQIQDPDGKIKYALPINDPYEEIYKNQKEYWRLLDPKHLVPEHKDSPLSVKVAWDVFVGRLNAAKALHKRLGLTSTVPTLVYYGSGINHPTADRVVYKVSKTGWWLAEGEKGKKYKHWTVNWNDAIPHGGIAEVTGRWGAAVYLGGDDTVRHQDEPLRNGFRTEIENKNHILEIVLQRPDGAGDGTVPESSGNALKAASHPVPGIEHEGAYTSKQSKEFTLAAIESFCREKFKAEKS
ncbi:alpha/beta hydrolase [Corallococcus llansteffanensis]|uniref:Alpha/beta hydrolase n=1 Tax=Corallococcus llansteffanensis TaxID=2316731 RepID=A0A3A8PXW6_9BACT|nr:alpha/beta hydrolase [Corallococcus llansteffanensis]RKH61279.1 alpha/beta hydrolase [Corallococcus llansteffanensis]